MRLASPGEAPTGAGAVGRSRRLRPLSRVARVARWTVGDTRVAERLPRRVVARSSRWCSRSSGARTARPMTRRAATALQTTSTAADPTTARICQWRKTRTDYQARSHSDGLDIHSLKRRVSFDCRELSPRARFSVGDRVAARRPLAALPAWAPGPLGPKYVGREQRKPARSCQERAGGQTSAQGGGRVARGARLACVTQSESAHLDPKKRTELMSAKIYPQ
jgi:hypothetical protein